MITSRRIATFTLSAFLGGAFITGVASGADVGTKTGGRVGPSLSITGNGRHLRPAGRLTTVGNFPSGSAVTPDGKFVWTVSSGHGRNDVTVVNVATGAVSQVLPLPGAYGGVAFSPDGTKAYVSGEPQGTAPAPLSGSVKGPGGDVIHTYSILSDGVATEGDLISLPPKSGAKAWPSRLAVTPDGSKLVVIQLQSKKVAVINLADKSTSQIELFGSTMNDVKISPDSSTAYVTDENAGTLSALNLGNSTVAWSVGLGGNGTGDGTGNKFSHPSGIALTPDGGTAYVAVSNRDLVAKVNLSNHSVTYTDLSRSPAWGVQPVAVTVSGNRAYVADSGEDALAVLDISGATPTLVGRIPTAAYPVAVEVAGGKLIWTAAKGLGSGPNALAANPGNGNPNHKYWGSEYFKYGTYVPDALLGRVGVLNEPTTGELATYTSQANAQVTPENFASAPPNTALKSNGPIKYVFYVVRENRTYDQIFGTNPKGDGDPKLELFDDNGVSGVTGGVTPNAHALVKRFPLLDHFYSNSEVSVDGHIITSMGQSIDYSQRALHANYANRGRNFEFIYPISFTPKVSLFDQAVRQNVSALNLGENESGTAGAAGDDGRSTYAAARAMYDTGYPQVFGCAAPPNTDKAVKGGKGNFLTSQSYCTQDSSAKNLKKVVFGQMLYHSRFDYWNNKFQTQLSSNKVPKLTYITLPNDHTNGVKPGYPTPSALVADNDYGLGQIVETISKSKIWSQSAIFVVEDDSQDGADHVDAHRMPAFVISPWTKKSAVVHTRYDQNSALRSAMMLLGLQPLTLADGLATPMYDAFMRTTDTPQTEKFKAIAPKYDLTKTATSYTLRKVGGIASALPFNELDQVPQSLFDYVIWKSIFGNSRPFPGAGPNASPVEAARTAGAIQAYKTGKNVARYLSATTPKGDQRLNISPVAEVARRASGRGDDE